MRFRIDNVFSTLAGAFVALVMFGSFGHAQSPAAPPALTGKISSQAEGAMEGVAVTAQRDGSSILISVYSNAQGQYSFPGGRLDPGSYTVSIRAAGYVLPGNDAPKSVDVTGASPAKLDLNLVPATKDQLAHQMTNLDWWNSMPGTTAQKDLLVRNIVNCGFCHTMERVVRSRYTPAEWPAVIQRMSSYAPDNTSGCGNGSVTTCDGASEMRIQVSSQLGAPEAPYRNADTKALGDYLATVNLSGGKQTWSYPLKPMPRPTGKATQLIVTTYIAPRQPSVIHDLSVDSKGNVWYGDSGWGYLSKLDPKTGKVTEYEAPNQRPTPAAGLDKTIGVQDVQVDMNDNVWAVLGGAQEAMFDTKTEKWVLSAMPTSVFAFITPFRAGDPQTVWTTGRTSATAPLTAYRLNFVTGKVEAHPIMVDAKTGKDFSGPQPITAYGLTGTVTPFCYQLDRDLKDNFICNDYYGSNIITVDAVTGETKVVPTPTPNAAPRRGHFDDQGRGYWFAEFWGDKIGMLDLATQKITEFPYPRKYQSPYSVITDKNGEAWGSSNGSDRLIRINPKTGETTEYLMPVYYDARKVEVDRSASNTTIWLPNKNLSELVRVEPLN